MRIERLARENGRTQGAKRRAWYRAQNPAHLTTVAALLGEALAARDAGAPDAAVALGAGACTELPLERMAAACERVTLVDLDAPGMSEAVEELPAGARARVDLLAADLTGGVSARLAAELRAQPWDDLAALDPSGRAALDAAASCLERCAVADPPEIAGLEAHGYGLVVSDLTLTQLFSLPLLDVLDALNVHAPRAADLRETSPRYVAVAREFRRRVARAHLSLLDTLLAEGGAGLLLTDVTGYLLAPKAGPHARERREALAVLPREVLALPEDLAARFAVIGSPRRWRWLVTQPTAETPGRAFDTVGLVFRRRE